jgi:hypothetical protein
MGRITKPTGILAPHDARQWTRRDATHLLWRTQFGATATEIAAAHKAGLAAELERLLTPQKETANFEDTESLLREAAHDTGAVGDLQAWWLHRMHYTANPLTEKLTLFWHNHFATSFSKVQSVPHDRAERPLSRRVTRQFSRAAARNGEGCGDAHLAGQQRQSEAPRQ